MIQCECNTQLFLIDSVEITEENNELFDVYRCPKCFKLMKVKRE